MSLYDESIEVVEYQTMLADIKSDRERIDSLTRWIHPLKDRPDVTIDHHGETWIVAPVSKNQGMFVPIFYRFTYCPKVKPSIVKRRDGADINRSMAARHIRYPNTRLWDESPKTAKPTKR
jgi:hypothetical protein